MLKRLLLSLLLLAALAGGWRPAVAGLHGTAGHGPAGHAAAVAAAPQADQVVQADADCDPAPHHCEHGAGTDGRAPMQDMSRCAAMAAGCFAPVIDAIRLEVVRTGEPTRLRLRGRPAALLPPVALTPDLRPPRTSL